MSNELVELADKLNETGYWAMYRRDIQTLFCTVDDPDDREVKELIIEIRKQEDRYTVKCFENKKPVLKEFIDEAALMDFIERYYWS